jgi:hypothetical protein
VVKRKNFRATVLAIASVLGLAGCATPIPYQPMSGGYGYSEQALETDRYRVTFSGNSATPRETVENYLLYRAAEVTVAHGYDHFVVVDKNTEQGTAGGPGGFGVGVGSGSRNRYSGFGLGTSATIWPGGGDSYVAYANIVLRRGARPADDPKAYDARAVLKRLEPTITR